MTAVLIKLWTLLSISCEFCCSEDATQKVCALRMGGRESNNLLNI